MCRRARSRIFLTSATNGPVGGLIDFGRIAILISRQSFSRRPGLLSLARLERWEKIERAADSILGGRKALDRAKDPGAALLGIGRERFRLQRRRGHARLGVLGKPRATMVESAEDVDLLQ